MTYEDEDTVEFQICPTEEDEANWRSIKDQDKTAPEQSDWDIFEALLSR